MATSVWKGHLTFGLISIPVRISAAARGERISFNQLHKVCHSRLKQPLFCPVCNRNVERSEIVKGYEHEKDQYVLFSEEELDKVEPPSAHVMEILEFVKLDELDPLYFDSSYYITPEYAGVKAYQLLMKAMEKLAQQLIESLAAPFDPQKYRDEYMENVKGMIDAKLKGQEVTQAAQPHMAPVIDLMEALKKSLAEKQAPVASSEAPVGKKPPTRALQPVPVAQKKVGKKAVG